MQYTYYNFINENDVQKFIAIEFKTDTKRHYSI